MDKIQKKIDYRLLKETIKDLEISVKFLKLKYEELAYTIQIYELERKYGHILYGNNQNNENNEQNETQTENNEKSNN